MFSRQTVISIWRIGFLFNLLCITLPAFPQLFPGLNGLAGSINPAGETRYDMKVVLRKIEAVKVDEGLRPGDNDEDLYGTIYVDRFNFGNKTGDFQRDEKVFWSAYGRAIEHIGVNSPKKIDKEILIVTSLSYDALINGELVIDGNLADDDFLLPQYECDCERNPSNSADIERRLRFDYARTKESIQRIQKGAGYTPIEYGKDKYFEMNFYEVNKDRQGSHIRFWFQVLVKAY